MSNAMDSRAFEQLLLRLNQETHLSDKKKDILFRTRGFFSAHQVSRLLYAFAIPSDKVQVIQMLEPRLCGMNCSEARDVIGALSIHNDKLRALESVKRVLTDCQTRGGIESILSAFPFEHDKERAISILMTVGSSEKKQVPAGGHQGYAALGGLYTQCRPLVPHLYGSIEQQNLSAPGQGEIHLPIYTKQRAMSSMYNSHPSYAFPQGRDYAADRRYPGNAVPRFATSQPGYELPQGPNYASDRQHHGTGPGFITSYSAPLLERDYGNPGMTGYQSHIFTGY